MWIKKFFLGLIVLLAGNLAFAQGTTANMEPAKPELGKPAPVFSAQQLDEKILNIEDWLKKKDKLILIAFWAGWCEPCQKEIPYLQKVYKEYHKKGLEIVCVNVDEPTETIKIYIKKMEMPGYPVSDLSRQISTLYDVSAIPSLFLIDPNGVLVSKGEELVGPKLEKTIAKHIKSLPKYEDLSR
jgi:thiol-disulfide isomerase/thioredoxin